MERFKAKKTILNSIKPLGVEKVTLENAFGRVLGEDIKTKFDIPEANKSAIDGYTFNLDLIDSFPTTLEIVGESRAGVPFKQSLGKAEAVFTMTGAVVPEGANVAVRVEDVKVEDNRVTIEKSPKVWDLINLEGEETKAKEKILSSGVELNYRLIGLLVNIGYYQIGVYTKPNIGVVVTGDEVKEPWIDSDKAGVKNSNLFILKGLLSKYANIRYYGVIQDNVESMVPIFKRALEENDILLSSGGASKGKYDFTRDIASKLKLNIKFTSTNIKPGRPLIFATSKDGLFFGLPGYPSALLTNTLEFLLPAVKKLSGIKEYQNQTIKAIAKDNFKSKLDRVDFLRVKLLYSDGKIFAYSAGTQQTSNFLSLAFSDGLIIADEQNSGVKNGDVVEVLRFE